MAAVLVKEYGICADAEGRLTNSLHIGVVQSAAIRLLSTWIRGLRIVHPNAAIRLHEGTDGEVTAWVLAGIVEVGIAGRMHPDLNDRIIYEDDFVIVLPTDHALATKASISLEDLDGEHMLMSSSGWGTLIAERLEVVSSHPEIVCFVRDITTLISMVREGLGLAVIPELALPTDRDGVRVIRLYPVLRHRVHALTKRKKVFTQEAMTFLGLVQRSSTNSG